MLLKKSPDGRAEALVSGGGGEDGSCSQAAISRERPQTKEMANRIYGLSLCMKGFATPALDHPCGLYFARESHIFGHDFARGYASYGLPRDSAGWTDRA